MRNQSNYELSFRMFQTKTVLGSVIQVLKWKNQVKESLEICWYMTKCTKFRPPSSLFKFCGEWIKWLSVLSKQIIKVSLELFTSVVELNIYYMLFIAGQLIINFFLLIAWIWSRIQIFKKCNKPSCCRMEVY